MNERVVKKSEQALMISSNRALFELLNLHTREIEELESKIAHLERALSKEREQSHRLREAMHYTERSKSFRVGYSLLHPAETTRKRILWIMGRKRL